MRKVLLLLLLVVTSSCFAAGKEGKANQVILSDEFQKFISKNMSINNRQQCLKPQFNYCKLAKIPLDNIKRLLYKHADTLSPAVINTVLITLKCAGERVIQYNPILTIIDYSLPSSQKRLWIFDLEKNELLFYTYVSHGIKSGTLDTTFFSNKLGSKASSLGIFTTDKPYFGRHGLSLKLNGLESVNNRANQRDIVMHAAWYVNQNFVEKYGRIGRSWGCPAVPLNLAKPIIDTIKNRSLFIAYYPSYSWLATSRFLKCNPQSLKDNSKNIKILSNEPDDEFRDEIFFIDRNHNNTREESEPILVMTADNYQHIFNSKVPLNRMLRRQINNTEYVALNGKEIRNLDSNNDGVVNDNDQYGLMNVSFVVPVVTNHRGYFATHFEFINFGKIQEIKLNSLPNIIQNHDYVIRFNNSFMNLRPNTVFIRWLGL